MKPKNPMTARDIHEMRIRGNQRRIEMLKRYEAPEKDLRLLAAEVEESKAWLAANPEEGGKAR